MENQPQDAQPVPVGRQLAYRAYRPLFVLCLDLAHGHAELQCVYEKFRLDLEAPAYSRKRLYEPARQGLVPGQHVPALVAKKGGNKRRKQAISQDVTWPV